MEKLKITKIYRSTKDKNGNALTTKDGRNYERVAIKCDKYGDKWLSGFGNSQNKDWQEGDEVEIEIEKKGEYLNFHLPPLTVKYKEFLDLKDRIVLLEDRVSELEGENIAKYTPGEKAFDEPQDDEVPF